MEHQKLGWRVICPSEPADQCIVMHCRLSDLKAFHWDLFHYTQQQSEIKIRKFMSSNHSKKIKALIPKCAMTAACLSVRFACPAWCNHPESYHNEAQWLGKSIQSSFDSHSMVHRTHIFNWQSKYSYYWPVPIYSTPTLCL